MGLFNTYNGIQLKINREMNHYNPGDKVDLRDGVYVGREGVVVIQKGVLVMTVSSLINKYGEELDLDLVMRQTGDQ
jgi:hypothetical protein